MRSLQRWLLGLLMVGLLYGCTLETSSSRDFTISFQSNDGRELDPLVITEGSGYTLPSPTEREGYTFLGWYKDANLSEPFQSSEPVIEDFTLYGKWEIHRYKVSFYDHLGNLLKEEEVDYKGGATAPQVPYREGYMFAGWSTTFHDVMGNLDIYPRYKDIENSKDLLITEYFEGYEENYLELYNNTGRTLDLSLYQIKIYSNGSKTSSITITLKDHIDHRDTLLIDQSSFPSLYFNGDDAIVLEKEGEIVDSVGYIGYGEALTVNGVINGTKDHLLLRNEQVLHPSPVFREEEWSVVSLFEGSKGVHTINYETLFPIEEPVDTKARRTTMNENLQNAVDAMNESYGGDYFVLPSTGDVNILVVPIQFSHDRFTNDELSLLSEGFFGYGTRFESVRSYYQKSSYGKLNLSGEVLYPYTAKYSADYYERYRAQNPNANGVDLLIEEIITYYSKYFSSLDLSLYDAQGDSFIDAVHLVYSVPMEYHADSIYWAYQYYYNATAGDNDWDYLSWGDYEFDTYVFSSIDFFYENDELNAWTIIHETGHLFGLDDYYDYTPGEDTNEGGLGGVDMMDATYGDHNPFSKLILDWIEPTIVKESTFLYLSPFDQDGDVILLSNRSHTLFDDYYLISFYRPQGLNEDQTYFTLDGIVVYDVRATLPTDYEKSDPNSYYFENNNSSSREKLISIVEADGDNSIPQTGEAANSDLFFEGDSVLLELNDGSFGYLYVHELNAGGAVLEIVIIQ